MIDIHAHILPGIDDGSESMEMSLDMLALAAECGVTEIVATPHVNIPGMYENYRSEKLRELFRELCREAENAEIPIRIHLGMEIFATEELPLLLSDGRAGGFGAGQYFLTEFSFEEDPLFCREILRKCRRRGFHPVIAHPERYVFVQDFPEMAYEWCTNGCALQLNKGSLLGRFGRQAQETAYALLRHGLCACVASDAHKSTRRSTYMREIASLLRSETGAEYADLLLRENPRRMLQGRTLLGAEPVPFV